MEHDVNQMREERRFCVDLFPFSVRDTVFSTFDSSWHSIPLERLFRQAYLSICFILSHDSLLFMSVNLVTRPLDSNELSVCQRRVIQFSRLFLLSFDVRYTLQGIFDSFSRFVWENEKQKPLWDVTWKRKTFIWSYGHLFAWKWCRGKVFQRPWCFFLDFYGSSWSLLLCFQSFLWFFTLLMVVFMGISLISWTTGKTRGDSKA